MKAQQSSCELLELISAPQPRALPQPSSPLSRWMQVGQRSLQALLHVFAPSEGPVIREIQTASGQLYWQVYNPETSSHLTFESEEAVRIWLEEVWMRNSAQSRVIDPALNLQFRSWLR